jgi:hypothetical protein
VGEVSQIERSRIDSPNHALYRIKQESSYPFFLRNHFALPFAIYRDIVNLPYGRVLSPFRSRYTMSRINFCAMSIRGCSIPSRQALTSTSLRSKRRTAFETDHKSRRPLWTFKSSFERNLPSYDRSTQRIPTDLL